MKMRNTTNTFVLALVALFALLISFGCADISVNPTADINGPGVIVDHKYKARESFSYTVDLSSQNTLKVKSINGFINVQSVSGTNQVMVSGEKVVSAETYPDAQTHLKDISIEIDELTNELLVRTSQPKYSNGRSYAVNYTIKVPSHLNVVVDNVNGGIKGKLSVPQNGTVDMSLQNGNVELDIPKNTSAVFSASLVNGSISAQNLTLHNRVATSKSLHGTLGNGQGTISLSTTNGNIDVSGF
jgi:DUF4097 and DUF4098 domain-containing protein YvlB